MESQRLSHLEITHNLSKQITVNVMHALHFYILKLKTLLNYYIIKTNPNSALHALEYIRAEEKEVNEKWRPSPWIPSIYDACGTLIVS